MQTNPPTNGYAREFSNQTPPQQKGVPDNGLASLISEFRKSGPLKTYDLNDNAEFRDKVAHELKPSEDLLAFCARTGLGPAEARNMTREAITRFCEQADKNNIAEGNNPAVWQPKRIPQHFVLDE